MRPYFCGVWVSGLKKKPSSLSEHHPPLNIMQPWWWCSFAAWWKLVSLFHLLAPEWRDVDTILPWDRMPLDRHTSMSLDFETHSLSIKMARHWTNKEHRLLMMMMIPTNDQPLIIIKHTENLGSKFWFDFLAHKERAKDGAWLSWGMQAFIQASFFLPILIKLDDWRDQRVAVFSPSSFRFSGIFSKVNNDDYEEMLAGVN